MTTQKKIIIEGPIGVGKSSLSRKLASSFNAELLLEQPAENPFLERFYKSPAQFSLATQLFFLFQRVKQCEESIGDTVIADFMLAKDPIFAELTLNQEELKLYKQVYSSLSIGESKPDLVIYLQAPVVVLKQRIKKRGIKYEQKIDGDYLQKLSDAYTDYFHVYQSSPLLIVNASEINPIDNEQHYKALLEQIESVGAGKHFFNPLI
jgi:deoxyadenosine/deoxycytidine kinase